MNAYKLYARQFLLLPVFCAVCLLSVAGVFKKTSTCNNNISFINKEQEAALPDSNTLKEALADFLAKVDSAQVDEIIPYYDPGFVSVRVVDAGPFIKMDYNQMINFWKMISERKGNAGSFNYKGIVTQSTTVHYIEIQGNTAYVLLTRIKNFGNGPEPVFYNLIWLYKNNKWYLSREIVHQRTLPSFH